MQATIEVVRLPLRTTVTTVRTDVAGRFQLWVSPGSYELVPRTPGFLLFARTVQLRVRANGLAHVVVTFFPRHPLPVAPAGAGS